MSDTTITSLDGAMKDLETILLTGYVLGVPGCVEFREKHYPTLNRIRGLLEEVDGLRTEKERLERRAWMVD